MRPTDRAKTIRVVVADDHPMFREGLKRLLETRAGVHVIATAADGEQAVRLVTQFDPDLLLLDLSMPRLDGFAVLRELRHRSVRARVLVVTAAIERHDVATALQLGAHGVVFKESASETLFKSVRAVMAGQYWVGRNAVADLRATLRDLATAESQRSRKPFGLTPRELEIIAVLLAGQSNSDIAVKFGISEKTVKHHLTNIFDKLGVSNRLDLALFALHHHLAMPADMPPPPESIGASIN